MKKKKELYIYIHIPYCKSKCPYCAFFKQVGNKEDLTDFFLRDLDSHDINFSNFEVTNHQITENYKTYFI